VNIDVTKVVLMADRVFFIIKPILTVVYILTFVLIVAWAVAIVIVGGAFSVVID
jgi:hypothetical protein